MAKMVVRTCTLRTSLIVLRCALVTKPAEVSVVRQKYGQAVATLYHTAFLARNGCDMCNDANYNWARCYFNRVANKIFKLQLNDLRHVWVAVSQAVASSFADRVQCAKTKQLLANAAARMSNHSPQTEEGEYAGQADISGVEQQDRKAYKALSLEFNCRVFFEARPAPDLPGRTSAPLPAGHELAMMQLSSSSPPPPSSLLAPTPVFRGELPAADDHHHQDDGMDMVKQDSPIEDCKGAVQKKVVQAVDRGEVVLLAQKPGFGKTRLMLELCTQARFTLIFTPTKPLQTQIIKDLKALSLPCASMHEAVTQSAEVAGNNGLTFAESQFLI